MSNWNENYYIGFITSLIAGVLAAVLVAFKDAIGKDWLITVFLFIIVIAMYFVGLAIYYFCFVRLKKSKEEKLNK